VEGGYLPLAPRIVNAGQAVQLGVHVTLPPGVGVLSSAPAADVGGGEAHWALGLNAGQSQSLRLGLRLPLGAQTFDFAARVDLVRNGQPQPYATYPLQVRSVGLETLAADAQGALGLLLPAAAAERQKVSTARKDLDDALNALARGDYEDAVDELIEAIDALRAVSSVPVHDARLALDRVLEAAQLRECRVQCNPSAPRAHNGAGFTPFNPLQRLEVRGGRPGPADWEWGLGPDTQQAGSLVQQNLDWVSGRSYKWTLSYDGQGGGTFSVWSGSTQLFSRTYAGTQPLHAGNALKFYVKASDGTGGARIEATVDTIAGMPAKAQLGTAGNGKFGEVAAYFYYPPMSSGFTASGTVKLTFPGSAPPQDSRLDFIVTSGNVSCTQ
jgi:hypothetical protein